MLDVTFGVEEEIHLRELRQSDAIIMLEWMHDMELVKAFREDFISKTMDDAREFVVNSAVLANNRCAYHYAVANRNDEYLGTISLDNVDWKNMCAEYVVALHRKAQGHRVGITATKQILSKAFDELGLQRVYLDCLDDNFRALRMYDKIGFVYEGEQRKSVCINGIFKNLKLYSMLREEYLLYKEEWALE